MFLDAIVSSYILNFRSGARHEMRYFESQRSLFAVMEKASLCVTPDGARHPHQRRIPQSVLGRAKQRLEAVAKSLRRARNFAALYQIVEDEIGSIRGIGSLTVYDIAHRLGAFLGKTPSLIYLHAGTRLGASAFGLRGKAITRRQLPDAFSRLTSAEIEDCLCISGTEQKWHLKNVVAYKNGFVELSYRSQSTSSQP